MTDPVPLGRGLPNTRVRRVMLAIQDVMSPSGLVTVLRQAGLQRFATELPPNDAETGVRAGELAALAQAIENYYGRGARGTLTRIGYASFDRLVRERSLRIFAIRLARRLLPRPLRPRLILGWLGGELARPGGRVSVERGDGWTLVDYAGDLTVGRQRDTAICWITIGEILQALRWATGREYDVGEVACRAAGSPACRFHVGRPVV